MKEPTKKELKQEIKQLRYVGQQLSNILYNLIQSHVDITNPNTKNLISKLVGEWDSILKSGTNWSKNEKQKIYK